RGDAQVVVGARSAVFAPTTKLGLIVVDEEHEASYKQDTAPRYHARDVAIKRAQLEHVPILLGSATPSLESYHRVAAAPAVPSGEVTGGATYHLLRLPNRVRGLALPHVEVVDLRVENRLRRGVHVISRRLEYLLRNTVDLGQQAILLLNRRGYSAFIQCGDCGDVSACPNCSISLTYHRAPERLVCHYCQHQEAPRDRCARCRGETLRQRGLGTQQVERILSERYPSARIARMDVDTTGAKWAHAEILDRVGRGEVDVLLGTQMIAKGLDFPNVTLVGVIDADTGINLPDFRASERCFQLLSQVAGRAGRGPKGGRVLIQTRLPSHHAVRCALTHDFHGFVREEAEGRDSPPYPPVVRLANVIVSGTREDTTAAVAQHAAAWVRALMQRRGTTGVTLIGPAPCPVERVKQRWRWHFLLKSEHPGELTRVGRYFVERFEVPKRDGLRLAFDRDPVALL
ncbi:MAG: replication restart helicase PriA, partial [Gemmatirosa sp.]